MSGKKLLPCWHCGGDAMVRKGLWFYVQCTTCPLELGANYDADGNQDGEYLTEDDAVAAWNTRVAVTDHDFALAVHDGRTWVCVEAALESDALKPIPGFTRDSIYRDSMREYGEWMSKADALIRDTARELRGLNDNGIATDCMEHERRIRELGIEVDE